MPTAAQVLGRFAAELHYADIPPAVAERAKDCIIDTIAAATFGSQLPWSHMVADYSQRYGNGGPCTLLGMPGTRVHAPFAALANGVFAHAFEQDGARDPNVGSHPGGTIVPALLAACEEAGVDGKTAVTAFVAANEVLTRIASAAHHSKISPEEIGFHSPGITGSYAAAVAVGRTFKLNAEQLTHALGIAGSLSAGLVAFTKSKQGAMIKRLHLGRASESGFLAARLASMGYTGPETVLEGKFGFLAAYCRDASPERLTENLGTTWETLRIGMKRYAFHMTAQTPVQSTRELMIEHGFTGADVAGIVIVGHEKILSHNNIVEPGDLTQAQYSVPFCVALALYRDPDDPKSIDASALEDAAIRAACRKIEVRPHAQSGLSNKDSTVTVRLKDGREFTRHKQLFKGLPDDPLTRAELRRKFMLLTEATGEAASARLFERLEHLETQPAFSAA